MNRPEWGATFFDDAVERGAVMYWGARGAIRRDERTLKRRLEIYPDRQSFTADDSTNKAAFVECINSEIIPYCEMCVKEGTVNSGEIFRSKSGNFFARIIERGGYLYIDAWEALTNVQL